MTAKKPNPRMEAAWERRKTYTAADFPDLTAIVDHAPDGEVKAECLEAKGAKLDRNDSGNGERLVLYYGEDLMHVPRLGWYRWTGQFWEADENAYYVLESAKAVRHRIRDEVPHIRLSHSEETSIKLASAIKRERLDLEAQDEPLSPEDEARLSAYRDIEARAVAPRKSLSSQRAAHGKFALTSGNSTRVSSMISMATPDCAKPIADLNTDPLAVNCQTGTIRFVQEIDEHEAAWSETDGKKWCARLDDHDREDLITKIMPVEYDPSAQCLEWQNFLERVCPDPEVRDFLKRWFGYSLLGKTTEQKLVFLYGGGRNGKSTAIDAIAGILGDYATTVPIETLTGDMQRKGSDATPDLVRIPGARMVRASEPEQGQRMKEALIKALTGGEPILIRRMMQEFVEVVPEFKLTISGNHKPEIRGGDDGIWRRVILVPFTEQIPIEEVDPHLPDKLKAERDGIFRWLVEGAIEWLSDGLKVPPAILEATEEYREESDPYHVFLNDVCDVGGDSDKVLTRDVCDAFRLWQEEMGDRAFSKRVVQRAFRTKSQTFRSRQGGTFAAVKDSLSYYVGVGVPKRLIEGLEAFRSNDK